MQYGRSSPTTTADSFKCEGNEADDAPIPDHPTLLEEEFFEHLDVDDEDYNPYLESEEDDGDDEDEKESGKLKPLR